MFADATQDAQEGQAAVIVSPLILDSDFCFQFYFDIRPYEGISMLQVVMENAGNKGEEVVIWQLSQIRLDFWEQGRVHISNPDQFTLIIKAIRTSKAEGYAAIDDISIIPNDHCTIFPADAQPPPPITTTASPLTQCDFQNDLCGWTFRPSSFMFNRTNGQILAEQGLQGPTVDHQESKERKIFILHGPILQGF